MKYRLELPPGPWGTVLLDPPWMLQTKGVRRKLHYDRMTTDDIAEMGIGDILADDGHLWLWTTNPHLPEALALLPRWGVAYRSMATWVKSRMGLGWWLRSKTEHLIFATRTKTNRATPRSWTTLIEGAMAEHSVKPESVIPMIEALSPGPRLELFARRDREGWNTMISDGDPADVFGDVDELGLPTADRAADILEAEHVRLFPRHEWVS